MSASRVMLCLLVTAAFILLAAGVGQVDEAPAPVPTYTRGAMCVACHTGLDKELVARFKETKHAKATPDKDKIAEMTPIDLYRHSVGLAADGKTFYEAGVGCQGCHGAGSLHMAAKTDLKNDTMLQPAEMKTSNQKLSVCGRCHGQYTVNGLPYVVNFKPGDDIFAIEGFKLDEITEPGPFQQLNELECSKHGANDVTCVTCHTAHEAMTGEYQLRKPLPDLCLQCHETEHPCKVEADQIPEGATCVSCHMPDGRHTFVTATGMM